MKRFMKIFVYLFIILNIAYNYGLLCAFPNVSTSSDTLSQSNYSMDLNQPNKRFSDFETSFNTHKESSTAISTNLFNLGTKAAKNIVTFLEDLFKAPTKDLTEFTNTSTEKTSYQNNCDIRLNGDKPNYYYFLPMMKGVLYKEGDSTTFSNNCFNKVTYKLEKLSLEKTVITITAENANSFFCSDFYWLSTSNIHTIKNILRSGKHTITLKNLSSDDLDEIRVSGFRLLSFCQGFFSSLESLFKSLELYLGGLGEHPSSFLPIFRPELPKYMTNANKDFLQEFVDWKPELRTFSSPIDIDEKEIKSGDFVAIYRLDGLDPLIMLGSGSRLGHSAVACWIENELYVLESQDGWYWPKHGIQRNKFSQWIKWAHNADFNVAILPLRQEIRDKFDVDKAMEWFTSGIEGLPYGYHNFLFSWIDTPHDNFPEATVQGEVLVSVFSIFEKVTKKTFDLIMGEALNMRVNKKGLTLPKVVAEAARMGKSFEELLAMPEIEGWEYSDGKNYVCSCFVVAFYKAGGIFGDLDIQATEFTPKDVYQLDLFDRSYKERRPKVCVDADPDLEYCQITGKYRVSLPGYSSIKPYNKMNEKCPSVAPKFDRPDGC